MSIPFNALARQVQATLKDRGYGLGSSGPAKDGVDGRAGDLTFAAVLAELAKGGPLAEPVAGFPDQAGEDRFFAELRRTGLFRSLDQSQVDGIKAKLAAFAAASWPLSFASYGMATSYWETGKRMQPVEEIGKGRGKSYGRPGRNGGQVPFGRGDVQLTHDVNYERADAELGLGGALVRDYSKALEPDISARIMVGGMQGGWFTGKRLGSYLPWEGPASFDQFKEARRIINGTDKWTEIAEIALKWQGCFEAGGWR